MRLMGQQGFDGASIRRIADAADVSPALVMHHFGSKEGLRASCDDLAVSLTRQALESVLAPVDLDSGARRSAAQILSQTFRDEEMAPVLAYLARALVDGSSACDALVDEIVASVLVVQERSIAAGAMAPTRDPQMRAVLLTIWDLAPVVLARHVARLTGADPLTPEGFARQAAATVEVYEHPLLVATGEETP
jgi:AcrR family transcriptional regulator